MSEPYTVQNRGNIWFNSDKQMISLIHKFPGGRIVFANFWGRLFF